MAIDARQNVTVTVTNVNEMPVVTGVTTASIVENSSSAVASYTGTDPERDTLTWSVSGNDFWVSQRGQLYFRSPPSFEQRTGYTVTLMAADDGGLSGSLSVTVTVTDMEEEGTVTITPPRGWDGTQFSATLTDGDGVTGPKIWQWQKSSNRSSWTDIMGEDRSSYTADVTDDVVGKYLRITVTYEDAPDSGKMASAVLAGRIGDSADKPMVNRTPRFDAATPAAFA